MLSVMQPSDRNFRAVAPATPAESRDRDALRFVHWVMGSIGHVWIRSGKLEEKIRSRYAADLAQLAEIGFDYLYSEGETFSILRFPLLLPALTVFGMWRAGEVLTLHRGTKIMLATPVLASKDRSTFANPTKLGVKFYTAFRDGSLLVSKNYVDETTPPPGVMKNCRKGTIGETWIAHQWRLRKLVEEGRSTLDDARFAAYVKISDQETAAW
jgi:hypothetical protein